MKAHSEVVLATVPGSGDRERLVVMLCQIVGEGSKIELRQQSWGDGVGWFTQTSVRLEPHQVAELRSALGGKTSRSAGFSHLPRAFSQFSPSEHTDSYPRVVRADSA